ncbi:MAG: hypothetical protein MI919_26935, partial [Holophagales bacterium]|nr:hypothetical protein [Holophagales bacterium]
MPHLPSQPDADEAASEPRSDGSEPVSGGGGSPSAGPRAPDSLDAAPASPGSAELLPPPPRGKLLEHLLDAEVDLDLAFDRLVDVQRGGGESRAVLRSTLPGETFASGDMTLAVLLASILSEYEDIERLLDGLKEHEAGLGAAGLLGGGDGDGGSMEDAVAVVSEAELADPATLSQVLEPLHDRRRFELLFDTAKATLDGLDIYELSRKPSVELVAVLRQQGNLRTVQSLVSFLRSLHTAADTFEAMDMPRLHVREYLKHLYLMQDWDEMSRLVGVLAVAV